jgi:hypothetical protein
MLLCCRFSQSNQVTASQDKIFQLAAQITANEPLTPKIQKQNVPVANP